MTNITKEIYERNKEKVVKTLEKRKEYEMVKHFKQNFEGIMGYKLYKLILEDLRKENNLAFRRVHNGKMMIMRI